MSVLRLASDSTTRKRVFTRFAYDRSDVDTIAHEVAVLRTASYEGRLQQIRDAAGIPGEASLTDTKVLQRITRESRDVAQGILQSHNDDLRAYLATLPKGQSQKELAAAVKQWQSDRAQWKAKQIAATEGMTARVQADRDVGERNNLAVRVRVTPRESSEPKCADLVARGWMRREDATFDLPLHPACRHSFEYDTRLSAALKGRKTVWIGDTVEVA